MAENIARMAIDPDSQAIIEAARQSNTHEMILSLPQGYDTPVDDATHLLSGGQKQRLALAHAFYGALFLILLDEANANLDAQGDAAFARVIQTASARRAMVMMVTHRMATVVLASHVLVPDQAGQRSFYLRAEAPHF